MMRLVASSSALFAPLPRVDGGFACVLADVPSRFRSNSAARPGRNALRHYPCHAMATIATLPVREVVARDALLWFWTTGPLLAIGAHLKVMRAWGFEPTAMGFVWIKLNPNAPPVQFTARDLFFGPGLTTRKNAEFVVLGRRGRPQRLAKDVFEIIVASRRESGRKPDESYHRIERYCEGPRFKPAIIAMLAFSFLGNIAALTLPIFVICVYDLGIGTRSTDTVVMLAVGAGIVLATNLILRTIRARMMAYFGARIDSLISMKSFEVILNMPVSMIESAPIGTQVSRLKQFESMRDFFTGTLASSIVDIPFIFIFLIAIAIWGGHLVWVPISLITIYAALAAITIPVTRNYVREIGIAKQRRHLLLQELFSKRRAIRALSAEDVWIARHQHVASLIARSSHRARRFNNIQQNLGEMLVSVAGIATLGLGALQVINGSMTSGALIGTMALIWRVLAPVQSTYLSLPRIEQAIQTFKQIDRLVRIRSERHAHSQRSFFRRFKGKISTQHLAFRYPQRPDAVLRNIQLEIKPGEMVAITGPSGSGKTTLLRIMAGLYPPALGSVLVDDMDLRQIDPAEWRSQIAYLPETANFFYGSFSSNIRSSCPDASDNDVMRRSARWGSTRKSTPCPRVSRCLTQQPDNREFSGCAETMEWRPRASFYWYAPISAG